MPSAPVTLAAAAVGAALVAYLPRLRQGFKRRSLETIVIKGACHSRTCREDRTRRTSARACTHSLEVSCIAHERFAVCTLDIWHCGLCSFAYLSPRVLCPRICVVQCGYCVLLDLRDSSDSCMLRAACGTSQLPCHNRPATADLAGHGIELHVSPFGATITRLIVPDKNGNMDGTGTQLHHCRAWPPPRRSFSHTIFPSIPRTFVSLFLHLRCLLWSHPYCFLSDVGTTCIKK